MKVESALFSAPSEWAEDGLWRQALAFSVRAPRRGEGMDGRQNRRDLLIVFGTVQRVMRAERAARDRGLDVDAAPAPRAVSSQCGVVLEGRADQAESIAAVLAEAGLEPQSDYRRFDDTWTPSALDAVAPAQAASLTRGSAYGGCERV